MKTKVFFEKCRVWWLGGYYIPVRNSWSYRLKKVHLSDKEKQLYEQKFGEKIILDTEFDEWYSSLIPAG
jgi:hypothetical protein